MDRFPVLRGIGLLLKMLAVLVLVLGVLGGLLLTSRNGGLFASLIPIVGAISYAIGLWAFAEIIGVLLAIEVNTRRS